MVQARAPWPKFWRAKDFLLVAKYCELEQSGISPKIQERAIKKRASSIGFSPPAV
jgi:hypothetical protein